MQHEFLTRQFQITDRGNYGYSEECQLCPYFLKMAVFSLSPIFPEEENFLMNQNLADNPAPCHWCFKTDSYTIACIIFSS